MCCCFFFQAEDGIRDLVRSRGLGDVYKRQIENFLRGLRAKLHSQPIQTAKRAVLLLPPPAPSTCLLYTSDAADERSSVDLGGRRIIKKKTKLYPAVPPAIRQTQK